MQDLEIVVVGAGIGGLTAAIALRRAGHRVTVLERTPEIRPVGAGISLWSNGVKVMDALGLGGEIAAHGGRMERLRYCGVAGDTLCDFSLWPLVERVGERPYPIRRSDLQAILLAAAGDCVRLGVPCTEVDQDDDAAWVTTEAGETLRADVVVVADGTHSRLRAAVLGRTVERVYVGYHNWNGVVPDELALGDPIAWTVHVGEGKRVSTMPVRDGQYVFFDVPLDDPTPTGRAPQEVLTEHFGGWSPAVRRLIDGLDPAGIANVSIHSHEPIDRFALGRIALLGDAAHTTAPDLGQGGCLAMEDALVLAGYLTTTSIGVSDALRRYSSERVPRAAQIVLRATKRAQLSHAHDVETTEAWYRELADEDGSRIIDGICQSILAGPLG